MQVPEELTVRAQGEPAGRCVGLVMANLWVQLCPAGSEGILMSEPSELLADA